MNLEPDTERAMTRNAVRPPLLHYIAHLPKLPGYFRGDGGVSTGWAFLDVAEAAYELGINRASVQSELKRDLRDRGVIDGVQDGALWRVHITFKGAQEVERTWHNCDCVASVRTPVL